MARRTNQLTLRGLEPQVLGEIQRVARAKGVSMNKAALGLLKRGAGIDEPAEASRCIGPAVDRFVGTWTTAQARAFSQSIGSLEQVDDELWK
ncbi:MAG TPA: hypothetical protein VM686_32415 [Polyangiaceae bacterium]|jgi:hypothetical protein|nr:hypothetical protein [Polyangiaceae bacterium]